MRDLKTFRAYDAPDVDLKNTGKILKMLRLENRLTVRELQDFFGFDYPNAIYDWEKGLKLPNMSNLIALSTLYEVPIDKILLSNEQDFYLRLQIIVLRGNCRFATKNCARKCFNQHFLKYRETLTTTLLVSALLTELKNYHFRKINLKKSTYKKFTMVLYRIY